MQAAMGPEELCIPRPGQSPVVAQRTPVERTHRPTNAIQALGPLPGQVPQWPLPAAHSWEVGTITTMPNCQEPFISYKLTKATSLTDSTA